ncbi:hemerythrin domain-containing protein [Streptomyces caeni]|uniref:Hemerythrin domain-containing protein n=1 Tax=Streptomyces caeni TaxID=2307231 RepID=A0ABW4J3B8_9ACTN
MCEYCGCRSLASIADLTRGHDAGATLVSHVRDAGREGDIARLAELARTIAAVPAPHTQLEEQGLFPAMAEEFPDHIAALEDEHRRIEAVLAEAADGPPADAGRPERLLDALALLREHILKGHDGVFPAALASLSTHQWEAVDAVRAPVGSRVPQPSHSA